MNQERIADISSQIQHFSPCSEASSREELGSELIAIRQLINQLELRFARDAAQFAIPQSQDADYDFDPVQWIRDECRMTSHAARTAVDIGEFEPQLQRSISSLIAGGLGLANLGWMACTASRLENSRSATSPFDETRLLGPAQKLSVQRFRRHCEQLIHQADHETFVAEQADGVDARRMRITVHDDGAVHLDALLDPEGGAVVRAAIEPYARKDSALDYRGLAQRRGDALVEVCSHLLDCGLVPQHGGQRPHMQVTATLETLLDYVGAPAAVMESGALLSGTTVQRLACDGTVSRVLVNSRSLVIDVGRAQRVVPVATRRALNIRDQGCAWPGCDRTASWTQAHHLIHWAEGGRTDLGNLLLLCRRHHWMVHEGGFAIARTDDNQILAFALPPGCHPSGRDPALLAS